MKSWLTIIGIGEDGLEGLKPKAKQALSRAELIIGGERHLDMLPADDNRPTMTWPSPLMILVEDVLKRRGEKIVILATGDPMHYGIGVTFAKQLPPDEMSVFPALSAFTLAASRLKWDLSRTVCLTLHGRPNELLLPHLQDGARLFALSDNGETPAEVAALLTRQGFGKSRMTVLEHMDGPEEKHLASLAVDWASNRCKDLNTIAIDCVADQPGNGIPLTTGLPDQAFVHDGQLTKQEIRAVTLSALFRSPGDLLWDVGAGSGSIGIEWMRQSPLGQAYAIEHHPDRIGYIKENRSALGVPGLKLIEGKAPDALSKLPVPDAIFIGGGLTAEGVFEACWQALKPGGVLVANTVTIEGEAKILALFRECGGTLKRLDYARAEQTGKFTTWKPFRQITQLRLVKE